MALPDEAFGELADEGGLAHAIDADDQHHVGTLDAHLERFRRGRERFAEFPGQCRAQLPRVVQFATGDTGLDRIDDSIRGVDTHVGHQQGRLELVQKLRVDHPFAEDQVADAFGNPPTRLGK